MQRATFARSIRIGSMPSRPAKPGLWRRSRTIRFARCATCRRFPISSASPRLPEEPAAWPWVEIVASDAGADGRIVGLLAQAGIDGIVVAGTGNGTIHQRIALELAAASRAGVAILRSSRCLEGSIVETEAGLFASAGELTPVKARVELIVRLLARRQGPKPAP